MKMTGISTLTTLLIAIVAINFVGAQELCSCSPTVFEFTISLDQNCDDDTINGNPGVVGSFCFLEVVEAVPEQTPAVAVEEEVEASDVTRTSTELSDETGEEADSGRALQDGTLSAVDIVSVQFLEFDNSGDLTVINQDDTYVDVSLADGDRLKFYSVSSMLDRSLPLVDQMSKPALVPGGASLILYGRTESGDIIRNRFFWLYDMNCGSENSPMNAGDEIGWVTVVETANAWPTFCPALPEGSPTISPRTDEPTLTPSRSPVVAPEPSTSPSTDAPSFSDAPVFSSDAPTPSLSYIPQPSGGWGYVPKHASQSSGGWNSGAFAKSSKGSKGGHTIGTYYPKEVWSKSKSAKGKGAKAKSAKSKGAKTKAVASKGAKDSKHSKGSSWNWGTYHASDRDSSFNVERRYSGATSLRYSLVALLSSLLMAIRQ